MSDSSALPTADAQTEANNKLLFWACFISLITTAFGFMIRALILGEWQATYELSPTQAGEIAGTGLWPFAISIILFSLVIDRIGYKTAMIFAFFCHLISAIVTVFAPQHFNPYWSLYFGTLIVALGNGTVEAVINPVVATLFPNEKTKWLNILHAGWPGGLVLAGLFIISLDNDGWLANLFNEGISVPWEAKVALLFIPTIAYGIMMIFCVFPVSERVAAGVSYREMLKEFGMGGALVVSFMIFSELTRVGTGLFAGDSELIAAMFGYSRWVLIVVATLGFGWYVHFSPGRPLFLFLLVLMIPLAITELSLDSWITDIMKPQLEGFAHAGWILVYTSFIMMILRFFAGPIVHRFSPLGLLAVSAAVAIVGLFFLSGAQGIAIIFLAATVYGFGKSFFWPTMLGVVAEQSPKGGALTLNAIAGVGMLGAGAIGAPLLGNLVDTRLETAMRDQPAIHEQIVVQEKSIFGDFAKVDSKRIQELPESKVEEIETLSNTIKQQLLTTVVIFPVIMLISYIGLIIYFRQKGGYKAEVLTGHAAEDDEFTGGVEGPIR